MTDSVFVEKARELTDGIGLCPSERARAVSGIATALQEAAAGVWQPIETAPKDGSAVLLFGSIANHPEKLISFNNDARVTGYWDEIDASWVATVSTWLGAFIQPTHWMPLPTPPKAGE